VRGRFITVEGPEGAGKSTLLPRIRAQLEACARRVLVTREPGGTVLGEEIRALLLAHRAAPMTEDAELLLMFAARAEHLRRVILPALEAGVWVLCDRFTDATYAYQGGGRGVCAERIAILENWVQGEVKPDLVLILDVPVGIGLGRARRRGVPDRFESEHQNFFDRVRATYLERARAWPESYRVIDASRSVEDVQAKVAEILSDFARDLQA
jgi:dTMP kinase